MPRTPFILTEDDCESLLATLREKALAASAAHDFAAHLVWEEAANMLHEARMSSFDRRAASKRARRRKALGLVTSP